VLSLFDTSDKRIVDIWLAFYDRPRDRGFFWRFVKPGFRHVEVWKYNGIFWLRIDPAMEHLDFTADIGPPWVSLAHLKPTVLRVTRAVPALKVREPWFVGPVTCVEIAKACLGMRDFFVRTPYQLYKKAKGGT
jgi:hypothetical protein